MISVLILTRNEELDLPDCLRSVAWCDDVHVLDSGSSDQTVEIARLHGAQVTLRAFDDYASQRNAGLALQFAHDWVFILDADERVTPELAEEIRRAVAAATERVAGFTVRRRDYLQGRWLKHAQMTPFYVRLVRPRRARYTRAINEVLTVEGEVSRLAAPLDHFPFSKGMARWTERHKAYAAAEAEELARGVALRSVSLRKALLARDFSQRRVAQKAIFYRLPLRPWIKWVYLMCVRGAFLDGRPGITYARLMRWYEALIERKYRELVADPRRS